MGITGLLPLLDPATRNCNISEFRGATVAIDTYCWLHKGATACADVLARGEETDVYVNFCMKYVKMLLKYDIKPILVFDGNHLPAKAITEKRRRETRKNAKVRAAELLRLGKKDEAWNYFRQSVDITPKMALNLIKECRRNDIDCIVAPYESDSQLAYLNLKGIADLVITEDSDLVLFGCTKVFFKIDINGNGRLVEKEKLPICMKMKPDKYTFDKFRYMCILSGCDYLDSLPGIGLKKALKFISLTAETDPVKFLGKIPRYLNMKNQVVSEEYIENFMVADATFRHQLVYDPITRKLTYLTDPALAGTRPEYCRNAGSFFDEDMAYQVAIGNMNPFSYEKYDDWSPTKSWKNSFHSIWSNTYIKKVSRKEQKELDKLDNFKLQNHRLKVENELKVEQKLMEEAQAQEFESQLSIYYHPKQKTNHLTYSEVKKEEILENEITEETCNESTKSEENINMKENKIKSPTLKKNFINPFLKKKLSKFNSTDIETSIVVKSKYFHSKSEDIIRGSSDMNDLYSGESNFEKTIQIEDEGNENADSRKRKIDSEESDISIDESCDNSRLTNEQVSNKKLQISSSQDFIKHSKKPKLTRCRSVGLPVKSAKKQLSLQVLFANINAKKQLIHN